jgi:preprotein translocase SecF subunit
VGSEEIKGFAIVLGIGISTSMFTALFVTRLIFNSLIAWGMLKDFSMRRLIGRPSVDWLALRRYFWPVSISAVVAGIAVFVTLSTVRTEATYDIEFLGGTSLQLDLEPGVTMTDEDMTKAIASDDAGVRSAVRWLAQAAGELENAEAAVGEVPGQFTLTSPTLTGEQLRVLMNRSIGDSLQRGGTRVVGHTVVYDSKPGMLTLNRFTDVVCVGGKKPGSACSRDSECSECVGGSRAGESCAKDADCPESECSLGSCEQPLLPSAADYARGASERLRGARVQSIGEIEPVEGTGLSFEVASIETNRELVQAAILAVLGDKLSVQRAMTFTTVRDEELTKEPFFVVSAEDHYISDVVGGDANYDIRRFRGGAAVVVVLDDSESPFPIPEFERRLREVGLQPEFEQYRTRDSVIFPLGPSTTRADGEAGYRRFAVLSVDESLLYDDDPAQWTESVAGSLKRQVEAALGQEKSLSKVVQFAPQIAGQTKNKTMFAIILALASIVSYLWLRFGRKEYGLAAIVALVHDVAITLGLVGVSQFLFNTVVGKALAIHPFRVDLPMIAAVLTVIGYSLNDTIVVFDRIRENKGRVESLNPRIINQSINQTLARTLLTSLTTFLVVFVLYVFGGKGVHGFSFALLIGVIVGTYSSVGVATPLLHRPKLLHGVVMVIVALAMIGLVFALVGHQTARLVMTGVVALACVVGIVRLARGPGYVPAGRPVPA